MANDDLLLESRRLNEQMLTIKVMHDDDVRDLEARFKLLCEIYEIFILVLYHQLF